jgi:hypothetical protein
MIPTPKKRRPFFAFGNVADGTISVGNIASGVVAIGFTFSIGVVSIGMNAVGSFVAIGMNACAPITLSVINGVGVVCLAGVNGLGAFGHGWVNGGFSPIVGVFLAVPQTLLALSLGKRLRAKVAESRAQEPVVTALRDAREGQGEVWLLATEVSAGPAPSTLRVRVDGEDVAVDVDPVAEAAVRGVLDGSAFVRARPITQPTDDAGGYREASVERRLVVTAVRALPARPLFHEPLRFHVAGLALGAALGVAGFVVSLLTG